MFWIIDPETPTIPYIFNTSGTLCPPHTPHTQRVKDLMTVKYCSASIIDQIKDLEVLNSYINECSKVTWDLCVQTPPMIISYQDDTFNFDLHTRFYTSDKDSSALLMYHWPTLLQETSNQIISKGVVQT